MTVWMERYAAEMSQRDLACIGLAVIGILIVVNCLVFLRHKTVNADEVKNKSAWWYAIMLVAIAVRAAWIWSPPPWYDEAYTMLVTRLPFDQMMQAVSGDVHPPLYYMIGWIVQGDLLALRVLSYLMSVLSLIVIWIITQDLGLSSPARLVTLAIMAILPTEVYYAGEARMYTMLQYLVLVQVFLMLNRKWLMLTLISILTLYTHNYGLYYCALIYGLALVRNDRGQWTRIIVSGIVALAEFTPWMAVLADQMNRLKSGYWIQATTPGSVIYDLLQIVYGVYMPDMAAIPAGISLGAILLGAIYYGIKSRRYTELTMTFGVLVLALITGAIYRPVLLFRALLPAMPFLAMLASIAVTSDKRSWIWSIPAGLTALFGCVWLVHLNATGESRAQSVMLTQAQSSAERVIHLNDATLLGYMLARPDQHHYLLYENGCMMDGALSDQTRSAMGIEYLTRDQLREGDEIAMIVGPLAHDCMVDTYYSLLSDLKPVQVEDKTFWVEGVWTYARR